MTVKKNANQWLVDIRPHGKGGKRVRKKFESKAEATRFEAFALNQATQGKEWNPEGIDKRRLNTLIDLWFTHHGHTLKRGAMRKSYLLNLSKIMGNPHAAKITKGDFAQLRTERLKEVKPNTANHDLAYLRAMFNELTRLGQWPYENPFNGIRRIKTDESELAFLDLEQIKMVLAALDKSKKSNAGLIARICLATGARWSEAANLSPSQLRNNQITYTGTKSGKNRSIPIDAALFKTIKTALPMTDGYSTLKRCFADLELNLPAGQLSHVFRHTFASHFMINGGNIITLQRILGHASIQMTMRYAHLSPDHFSEVLTCNPLAGMST